MPAGRHSPSRPARRGYRPQAARPIRAGEPQPEQVAAVFRLGEILIGRARMHDPVIADELHVAGTEIHVEMDLGIFGERIHRITRGDEFGRQARHFGKRCAFCIALRT